MTDPTTGNTNPLGFNGFATLEFDGPRLTVRHIDAERGLLLEEVWSVADGGALHGERIPLQIHYHDLIVHSACLNDAIS